jgi:hypothetical protein
MYKALHHAYGYGVASGSARFYLLGYQLIQLRALAFDPESGRIQTDPHNIMHNNPYIDQTKEWP